MTLYFNFLHQEEKSCLCLMSSTDKTGCLLSIGQKSKYVNLFTCSILGTPKQTGLRTPQCSQHWCLTTYLGQNSINTLVYCSHYLDGDYLDVDSVPRRCE